MNKLSITTALLAGMSPFVGSAEVLPHLPSPGPQRPRTPSTPHAAHRTAEEANEKTRRRRKQRQKAAGKKRR